MDIQENEEGANISNWTEEEDAYCVWSFMMNPIGGICDYLGKPSDRPVKEYQRRYFEILKSVDLQRRANEYMKGDIVHFHRVKFSRLEEYTLFNATRLLKTTNPSKIIEKFQPFLHLTRTGNSIVAQMQKKKASSYPIELFMFKKYKKMLIDSCSQNDLDSIKVPIDPREVKKHAIQSVRSRMKPVNYFQTFGDILNHAQPIFGKTDFYAIRGSGQPIIIKKTSIKIGRKVNTDDIIDIDLSYLRSNKISRHHVTIGLASDAYFYLTVFGRDIIVNGMVIKRDQIARLNHADIVDIGGYMFIFVENIAFMSTLRNIPNLS